jgi:isopentenyl-diphosphate delta-isomerase
MTKNKIVSFDSEMLFVVDEQDNVVDYKSKIACHRGNGILHRAFSLFIFNSRRELMVQQRAAQKHLWPLFWSNTCCSHPRKGEELDEAIRRRLMEEIGISTGLKYLFKFQYQANYRKIGSENEICAVYIGKSDARPQINKNEIADWKFISIPELTEELKNHPRRYTPWFKIEWQRLITDYIDEINAL